MLLITVFQAYKHIISNLSIDCFIFKLLIGLSYSSLLNSGKFQISFNLAHLSLMSGWNFIYSKIRLHLLLNIVAM